MPKRAILANKWSFERGLIIACCLSTLCSANLPAASDTFIDYQNYNHGYCPDCNCYPCRCSEEYPYDEDDEDEEEEGPACASGGCAKPDPCDPAPVCGTNCGISLCVVGLVVAGVAAVGALIVSSNSGSSISH